MSCPICHHSSCVVSFHSLEEQARHDARQGMSDDVDTLRRELQDAQDEVKRLTDLLEEERLQAKADAQAWDIEDSNR